MKTATEISTEIRYWQGMLEGLKSGSGEAAKDKVIETKATLRTLHWVLGEEEQQVKHP